MFKNLISDIKPIVPGLEKDSFEKDDIFNNKDLLKKGIYRESISEDGDNIVMTKEFSSGDNSFIKMQKTILSKDDFSTQSNNDITTKDQLIEEKKDLRRLMIALSNDQNFEEAAIIRNKIEILDKILEYKK